MHAVLKAYSDALKKRPKDVVLAQSNGLLFLHNRCMFKRLFKRSPKAAPRPEQPAGKPLHLFIDPVNGVTNARLLQQQSDVLARMRFQARSGIAAVRQAGVHEAASKSSHEC